jgi:hypothetical protein
MSVRVVNLAGLGLESQHRGIRLPDETDEPAAQPAADDVKLSPEAVEDEPVPPELASISNLTLRGTTLGLFGPRSIVRKAMYDFLIWT